MIVDCSRDFLIHHDHTTLYMEIDITSVIISLTCKRHNPYTRPTKKEVLINIA